MVYHERVRASGTLLIQEILRENGLIGADEDSGPSSVCLTCTKPASEKHTDHEFRPLRFVAMFSGLNKVNLTSIRERYNSAANLRGEWCSILVGSRLIRESYDFTAIRHLFVVSLPVSISQLVQVFGRCVRRGSHLRLPPEDRNVKVHVLINTSGSQKEPDGKIRVPSTIENPEARRYALKLETHIAVQQIEREFARSAIDSGINRHAITWPAHDNIDMLLFDEPVAFTSDRGLRVDTFFAYGHGRREIQYTIDLIKRLFQWRHVWRAPELLAAIRQPPFSVAQNPAMISDSSIIIALSYLVANTVSVVNASDRMVVIGDRRFLIVTSEDTRTKTKAPTIADDEIARIFASENIFTLALVESVDVAGIQKSRAVADIESFLRNSVIVEDDVIPLSAYELQAQLDDIIIKDLQRYKIAQEEKTTNIARRMAPFLTQFSTDQQRTIAQQFVMNDDFRKEFAALYEFMNLLGIFVSFGFVKKYKNIAIRVAESFALSRKNDMPIAFGDGSVIRLFTGTEWIVINRGTLNMHVEFEEDGDIIGIYKQFPYAVKFQLRDPIQVLRAKLTSVQGRRDARLLERGSVCATNTRETVLKFARRAGVKDAKLKDQSTVSEICFEIQIGLLTKEIKARANPRVLLKYLYGWWNVVPTPF